MSKTAVVTYDFFDVFFSNYSVDNVLLETDGCTCKLSMKTIARIFRTNKEKRVSKILFYHCCCIVIKKGVFSGGTV